MSDDAAGGHPDVWNPMTVGQILGALYTLIHPYTTNPYIIGWSVGNEKNQVIAPSEVTGILDMASTTPAKQALVNFAVSTIYKGDIRKLASNWDITATTLGDVYNADPAPDNVPSADVTAMREYYENTYYAQLYATVKAIDNHHLYLGSWTLAKGNPDDWAIAAANCDVMGTDYYPTNFQDDAVLKQIRAAKKPVLIGEFSFPSTYGGVRGFGWQKYSGVVALTDLVAGQMYRQWLHAASDNEYIVGVEWFMYVDEPVSGNGITDGVSPDPTAVVVGENYAFGLVSVTDRPKYDLVDQVWATNREVYTKLGMLK